MAANIEQELDRVLAALRSAFGDDLVSVALFGSAAEDRLRTTSDVNLIVVLRAFDSRKADETREQIRFAHSTIRLEPMFVLERELAPAAEAFAVKFGDLSRRHRVLFGSDPFTTLEISREAAVRRVRQVLLNLVLRMRQRYVLTSLREEQLARALADFVGPLRASAAAILELEDGTVLAPRDALARLTREIRSADGQKLLALLSEAHDTGILPPGVVAPTFLSWIEVASALRDRAERFA